MASLGNANVCHRPPARHTPRKRGENGDKNWGVLALRTRRYASLNRTVSRPVTFFQHVSDTLPPLFMPLQFLGGRSVMSLGSGSLSAMPVQEEPSPFDLLGALRAAQHPTHAPHFTPPLCHPRALSAEHAHRFWSVLDLAIACFKPGHAKNLPAGALKGKKSCVFEGR